MVIREIPHILAIRAPRGVIRRREARNWPVLLDRVARSHPDDVVLLAVSDTTHLFRRRTICLANWILLLCVPQSLFSLHEFMLTVIGQSSARARPAWRSRTAGVDWLIEHRTRQRRPAGTPAAGRGAQLAQLVPDGPQPLRVVGVLRPVDRGQDILSGLGAQSGGDIPGMPSVASTNDTSNMVEISAWRHCCFLCKSK